MLCEVLIYNKGIDKVCFFEWLISILDVYIEIGGVNCVVLKDDMVIKKRIENIK
jgi:hypothetical protein